MDNHATTPLDPRVLDAMMPFLTKQFGNAASITHAYGWRAADAVDVARRQLAGLIGADPKEIIFTSGATESLNLAVKGVVRHSKRPRKHIVTSRVDHKALLDTCKAMEREGAAVTYLTPDSDGRVSPDEVERALTTDTVLCAITAVNNEVGTVNPIFEIGRVTRANKIAFLVDAAQAVGRIPLDVNAMNIDLLAISAHKFYGPKGVGALFRRQNPLVSLAPLLHGGGQELSMRPGTLNVPAVVGLGAAARFAHDEMEVECARVAALRDSLRAKLAERLEIRVNGSLEHRSPVNLNVSFPGVDGEALLHEVSEHVAVSSGAACSAGSGQGSYVLKTLGLSNELVLASLRFGLGRFTTAEEVDRVAEHVIRIVARLRAAPRR